jgi:hypothetical protein
MNDCVGRPALGRRTGSAVPRRIARPIIIESRRQRQPTDRHYSVARVNGGRLADCRYVHILMADGRMPGQTLGPMLDEHECRSQDREAANGSYELLNALGTPTGTITGGIRVIRCRRRLSTGRGAGWALVPGSLRQLPGSTRVWFVDASVILPNLDISPPRSL